MCAPSCPGAGTEHLFYHRPPGRDWLLTISPVDVDDGRSLVDKSPSVVDGRPSVGPEHNM